MAQDSIHRYTQPPSKVLHIRNLPYEVTEEELTDLCAPFGRLVQTKLNVGSNKNQAFVEFPEIGAAIQMVTYYANSADPAKVRGKTVYLQYSTRQEIPDIVVTLDTLYLVFSAFGEVQKIATFEKNAGFQALVQYADIHVADQVRRELDGRHIPRHLLNDTPNPPMFKISFSQHTDLNVKFQSHRSRDYTNQYLPVAPTAQDANLSIQAPTQGNPPEGNVLLCAIENKAYPVTVDPLHTVFSPYGFVQKMAIFEKNSTWQVLVQYPDEMSAGNAKLALDGHAIYDGGFNRLKINFSVHRDLNVKANNERSWDYTQPGGVPPMNGAPMQMSGPAFPNQPLTNGLPLLDMGLGLMGGGPPTLGPPALAPPPNLGGPNNSFGSGNLGPPANSFGAPGLAGPTNSFGSGGLGPSAGGSFGSDGKGSGSGFTQRRSGLQGEPLQISGLEYEEAHNAAVRAAQGGAVGPGPSQPRPPSGRGPIQAPNPQQQPPYNPQQYTRPGPASPPGQQYNSSSGYQGHSGPQYRPPPQQPPSAIRPPPPTPSAYGSAAPQPASYQQPAGRPPYNPPPQPSPYY